METKTAFGSSMSRKSLAALLLLAALVAVPTVLATREASADVRPNAIGMYISGTLAPGATKKHGPVYEQRGAVLSLDYLFWQPGSAPIVIGFFVNGHYYNVTVTGGGVGGTMMIPETGQNYFFVSNPNAGTTVTYSGHITWP